MRESEKDPKVAEVLEDFFGRSTAIQRDRCVNPPFGCGREISPADIGDWKETVQREYSISGMCSRCQAQVFGPEEGEGCNGLCVSAADIGVGSVNQIAYAHPDCPEHQRFYKEPER
jgi:hypothetical protein